MKKMQNSKKFAMGWIIKNHLRSSCEGYGLLVDDSAIQVPEISVDLIRIHAQAL